MISNQKTLFGIVILIPILITVFLFGGSFVNRRDFQARYNFLFFRPDYSQICSINNKADEATNYVGFFSNKNNRNDFINKYNEYTNLKNQGIKEENTYQKCYEQLEVFEVAKNQSRTITNEELLNLEIFSDSASIKTLDPDGVKFVGSNNDYNYNQNRSHFPVFFPFNEDANYLFGYNSNVYLMKNKTKKFLPLNIYDMYFIGFIKQ